MTCEQCGTNVNVKGCLLCGAPVCCPRCCREAIDDAQRALDAEREKVKRLSTCGTDHSTPWWQVKCEDLEAQLATLQAQLADRDAMILQMGKQAAVLAKENMAVKAQLRQVEGQSQQQAEEAVIVFAKYTTLRQLVEAFVQHFDSDFENPGLELYGRVNGGEISNGGNGLNELLAKARATLAAQDAGKEVGNGNS